MLNSDSGLKLNEPDGIKILNVSIVPRLRLNLFINFIPYIFYLFIQVY